MLPKTTEGRAFALAGLFVIAVLVVFVVQGRALASPYATPFWGTTSASPESALCQVSTLSRVSEGADYGACKSGSGCAAPCDGVVIDVRTGELMVDFTLFTTPGLVGDNMFSVRWRSMLSGASQFGRQALPSWETTAEYVVLNSSDPNANGGHKLLVRRPSGRIDTFGWNGTGYDSPPDALETLSKNVGGAYVLTDKWGRSLPSAAGT